MLTQLTSNNVFFFRMNGGTCWQVVRRRQQKWRIQLQNGSLTDHGAKYSLCLRWRDLWSLVGTLRTIWMVSRGFLIAQTLTGRRLFEYIVFCC